MKNKIQCCFSKLKSEVYTDASFMRQKRMAIGIWSKDFNINSSYKLKGYPDSNRAELGAIFGGMLYIKNRHEDVNILTDSLTSLRLFSEAPKISSDSPVPWRRFMLHSTTFLPER